MRPIIVLIIIITAIFNYLSFAQKPVKNIIITGFVTDNNKTPISGAMILIDNQNTFSVTDNEGFYKVKIRSDSKLIAIFTTFNGLSETPINGRKTINFTINIKGRPQRIENSNKENEEIINVGHGSINKNDLIAPVGKINNDDKRNISYQSIYEMISKVPGVIVSERDITIQGATSISGFATQPLFVLDGSIVNSIDNISPQMVKSIEILKGPSASIYGSRGANGVILINLKGTK